MKQKYILFALFSLFFLKGVSQSNYSVASIPFQQYSGSLASLPSNDDTYSTPIVLPFQFDFYGNTYNQIKVSTNGTIVFGPIGSFAPWSFNQTIPNGAFPEKNAILGCFHDMNNSDGQGTITYGTYGDAPFRKFVVYFDNNSQFSCNAAAKSSFQMILIETSNIIDVQLIDKQLCATWNSGNAVTGLINGDGTQGITPPGRNTGAWTAFHEGWRFSRAGYYSNYSFVVCDDNNDGFASFDLNVANNDLSYMNPQFFETMTDAQTGANPISISSSYTNLSNPQTIYASGNGVIMPVTLSAIDCTIDTDNDSVATNDEDVNADTNLANDDTDGDGIPNYMDNDDDGDLVLTNLEYVFPRLNAQNPSVLLDTDGDTIPNYLDNDDDGDGVLTWKEDYNGDGNPVNDDTNTNGTPDYLEMGVALGVTQNISQDIQLYPNPVASILSIENTSGNEISNVSIYNINGSLIKQVKATNSVTTIDVAELQSGVYFVKVEMNNQVQNYKFIKK